MKKTICLLTHRKVRQQHVHHITTPQTFPEVTIRTVLYGGKKQNLVHTSVGLVRISLCTGDSGSCARALCAGLVRSLVRSLLRSLLAANSRAPQDLVREPCAQAFLAQPAPHNYTGLCASHCATIGGVCATRFAAARLLHN